MKKTKRHPAGVTLLSGEFVHNIDQWRKFAALPFRPINLSNEGTPAVWTLKEDGKPIAQWHEADMPGFADWLWNRIAQLHGAWHVARDELLHVDSNVDAGRASGKKRAGNNSKAAKIRAKAEWLSKRNFDPLLNVPKIAADVFCTERYVRKILKVDS